MPASKPKKTSGGGKKLPSKPQSAKPAERINLSAVFRKCREDHPVAFEDPAEGEAIDPVFLTLGTAMGGGARRGRFVEVFGNEGTGKTTLTVQHVGADLRPGQLALFLDFEHTFTPEWVARYTGRQVVHLSEAEAWFKTATADHPAVILWAQPGTLEDGVGLADDLVRSLGERFRHVVFDSVAAMVPAAQVEAGPEDTLPAIRARRLGWWLEKAVRIYAHNGTTVWLVNQVREKLGAMGFSELARIQTPGGRGPKFYSTHRLYLQQGMDRRWAGILGQDSTAVEVTVVKNKADPTRRGKTQLVLVPGLGFSPEVEIMDLAEERRVLAPAGPGAFTFQGLGPYSRKGFLLALLDKTRGRFLYDKIRVETLKAFGDKPIWFSDMVPKGPTFTLDTEDAPIVLSEEGAR